MKVLFCHNYYQVRGGEDESFEAEAALIESHGHDVVRFTLHNNAIADISRLTVSHRAIWNNGVFRQLRQIMRRERPAVMHCTNVFPLVSPSAYYAARAEGVPVVQALRNYRLFCANSFFQREGRVCEQCLHTRVPWPAVKYKCYRGSRAASAVVATMLSVHNAIGTWTQAVDLYVTPSEFARRKCIEGGIPADRIVTHSNFLHVDPGPRTGRGGYAVFAGRLSAEKGLDTMLDAWAKLRLDLPLKILGDGPEVGRVAAAAAQDNRIELLGRRAHDETLSIIGEAACLVMPSVCYETFGRAIIEAFAVGTPVIASRLGAMSEIVDEGRTGAQFDAGNSSDLAIAVERLIGAPEALALMRSAVRREFELKYMAESGYRRLMGIYDRAVKAESERAPETHELCT